MNRNVMIALVLMVLAVVVLLITQDRVDVNLLGYKLDSLRASFVYLGWVVFGVIIGALLK
jgi:hypothetical protein